MGRNRRQAASTSFAPVSPPTKSWRVFGVCRPGTITEPSFRSRCSHFEEVSMRHYAAAVTVMLVMGTSPVYAQDTLFVVTMTSADVHKAPSTGSAVIARAPRGKAFEVRRELGSWVSVAWPQADTGVAYLHVAWGRITHGAAVEAPRAIGAGLAVPSPASEPLSSTTADRKSVV